MTPASNENRAGAVRRHAVATAVSLTALALCAVSIELALRTGLIANDFHAQAASERSWREAEHRVLVLGDSFFVPGGGTGRRVSEALALRGVAVRNLAVSGTGPFEYLELLEGAAVEPAPDVVLLGYYVGNDLTDVQNNPKYDPSRRGMAIRTDVPVPRSPEDGALQRSHLWRWLRRELAGNRPVPPRFPWERFEAAGIPRHLIEAARERRLNPWLMMLALRNPNYLLDNVLMESEGNQRAWGKVRELLGAIDDLARERGARLAMVVFPRSIQLDDSHFAFFGALGFHLDPRTIGSQRPQTLLARFCDERAIPMLDLLPAFRERAGEELYLELDDHLDREGHRLAAERIVSFVAAQLGLGG